MRAVVGDKLELGAHGHGFGAREDVILRLAAIPRVFLIPRKPFLAREHVFEGPFHAGIVPESPRVYPAARFGILTRK